MAITVGVNAYVTYAEYLAWAALRGYTVTATQPQVEAAIVIASLDYIDAGHSFLGDPVSDSQSMKLPTDQVTIAQIKPAANAATDMQIKGLLMVDTSTTSTSGTVESESKSVGPLSKSVTYKSGSAQTYKRIAPLVDSLLRPFLSGSLGMVYRL
jgi:hypothetical protein